MLPTSISLARWNRKEAEYIGFECFAEKNESATRRTKGGGTLFLPRRGKLVSAKLISKHGYRRQRVWGRGLCSSWTQERGDNLVILLTRSQKRPNTSTMSLVKTLDHSVGWPFVPSIFLVLFLTSNDLLEIGRGHVMVQTSTGIL